MVRSILLITMIALSGFLETPSRLEAQTVTNVAPVPGPYMAMPAIRSAPNPYSNPGQAQSMPYWMRPQPSRTGTGAVPMNRPIPRNFIPGWVWTPYAPNYAPNGRQMNSGQEWRGSGHGYRANPPPPGYAQGRWPTPPYGAPQGYGAPMPPNQ